MNPNLVTISGYIPLSAELAAELAERDRLQAIGLWHGPPEPADSILRRQLAGHPFGPYRRTP